MENSVPCTVNFIPPGTIRFMLYRNTIDMITAFQIRNPDVTIEECSRFINMGIRRMLFEFEREREPDAPNECSLHGVCGTDTEPCSSSNVSDNG